MAGKGGYQKPNKPATFSGPGKFARRTDGGPGDVRQPTQDIPSSSYGEGAQTRDISTAAPLSASGGIGNKQITPGQVSAPSVPLGSPSQRPDEPVTHGINVGPGGGSNVLNLQNNTQTQYQSAQEMIDAMASDPNASPTMKYLAQRITQVY